MIDTLKKPGAALTDEAREAIAARAWEAGKSSRLPLVGVASDRLRRIHQALVIGSLRERETLIELRAPKHRIAAVDRKLRDLGVDTKTLPRPAAGVVR